MAGNNAVWGIDIGQCSLKAIRCRQGDSAGHLVAEAFDYIAYPKILSQPGSEPAELIREALQSFLSRNTVRGDRVAIAVPGQSGLARFIKLPPVESKKIPDIVRYEARQQIPFDLADVIWDYQRMGGGAEEEGFALETEVGLFAMKRDQVYRALEPFTNQGIKVDIIQLTPLALYNFLLFDQMAELPPLDQYDPDDPPPSTVILSLGTDATDLVVTNGYRVWQRSIPLGGSHFTKALTKELKLTFAKAEHLKCNAAAAPDPRALFQAMRPVFNDLLTEIQRSIGYFTSIDRRAKIEKIVALGNAMKMPGLRRYLSQSLSVEVVRLDAFGRLSGSEVVGAPAFKENLLSFPVAYGLAVQALGVGRGTLKTNLLPPEIVKDRFIRGKKPWALAGAALLLLGCAVGYGSRSLALGSVSAKSYDAAVEQMKRVTGRSGTLKTDATAAEEAFKTAQGTAQHLVGNVDNRVTWLELLRAINEALPAEEPPEKRPTDVHRWKGLRIESIESQHIPDVSVWYTGVKDRYRSTADPAQAAPPVGPTGTETAPAGTEPTTPTGATAPPPPPVPMPQAPTPTGLPADPSALPADPNAAGMAGTTGTTEGGGPTGPGWIIRLTGYHFHNPEATMGEVADDKLAHLSGGQYVYETLIRNLEQNKILLPAIRKGAAAATDDKNEDLVSMAELGIAYPTLTYQSTIVAVPMADPNGGAPDAAGAAVPGGVAVPGVPGAGKDQKQIQVRQFQFTVEFLWTPKPPTKRLEEKKQQAEAQAATGTTP